MPQNIEFVNTAAERVKSVRMLLGYSRNKFEKITGIKSDTLRAWETSINHLTGKGANKLEVALKKLGVHCSTKWLLTGDGENPFRNLYSTKKHPTTQSNPALATQNLSEDEIISKEIEFFNQINPHPTVIIISDDGMNPLYAIGDYVGGNKVFGEDIDILSNSNCIVVTKKGHVLCRRLHKDIKTNLFNLYCINPQTIIAEQTLYNVEIECAAEIILHRRHPKKYSKTQ